MTEKASSRLTLSESIDLVIERRTHDDWLLFVSPEGLRCLNLRFDENGDPNKPLQLMFKRSSELKKYYAQIRGWFEERELDWKDVTIDHKKYMTTQLPPDSKAIERLILSVQNDIFEISKTQITSPDSGLSLKLQGIKAPYIGLFCAFTIMICLVAYVLYQAYRLSELGNPSMKALMWEEGFMILAIALGIWGLRLSGLKTGDSQKKTSKWKSSKIIFRRLIMLALLFLGFCTY